MHVDAVVIGAGIVGASCTFFLAQEGLKVALVERGGIASGTSGSGEGNILVSDKEPGAELALAQQGCLVWKRLASILPDDFEFEEKGGVVVAETDEHLHALTRRTSALGGAGVTAHLLTSSELRELEPHLAHDLAGAAYFPQDAQVQPMLAWRWWVSISPSSRAKAMWSSLSRCRGSSFIRSLRQVIQRPSTRVIRSLRWPQSLRGRKAAPSCWEAAANWSASIPPLRCLWYRRLYGELCATSPSWLTRMLCAPTLGSVPSPLTTCRSLGRSRMYPVTTLIRAMKGQGLVLDPSVASCSVNSSWGKRSIWIWRLSCQHVFKRVECVHKEFSRF